MARYQIRIPEGMEIEDFIHELTAKSWQLLTQVSQGISWPAKKDDLFHAYQESIKEAFVPLVKAYKLCGLSNICSEELDTTELSLESHVLDASPTDRIFQLFIKGTIKDFIEHITNASLSSLQVCLKPGAAEEVRGFLEVAFRDVLGEYLYACPACGKTELCVCSQSSPIAVWKDDPQQK